MTAQLVAQAVVSGIILGALYGLIGCSLTVVYGTMRVVNFAHGDFVVGGCYAALVLLGSTRLNPLLDLPAVFVGFFGLGMMLYHAIMPRLARAEDPELASFLSFYGVSLMAGAVMLYLFGADTRALDYTFHPIALQVWGIFLPTARLVALAAGLVLIVLLTWFLYRTLPGKALRAAIMNPGAIGIVGVDIARLSALAFGLAIGLAGMTGVLIALVFPAFDPSSGMDFTLLTRHTNR
jgi:branched-chain amino acid transport system permease protein